VAVFPALVENQSPPFGLVKTLNPKWNFAAALGPSGSGKTVAPNLGLITGPLPTTAFTFAKGNNPFLGDAVSISSSGEYAEYTSFTSTNTFSLVAIWKPTSSGVNRSPIDGDANDGSREYQFRLNDLNQPEFIRFDISSNPYFATGVAVANPTAPCILVGVSNNSIFTVYYAEIPFRGFQKVTTNPGFTLQQAFRHRFYQRAGGGGTNLASGLHAFEGIALRAWSDAEATDLCKHPWKIFEDPFASFYYTPAGGGGDVSVGLTGVSATAATGNVAASTTVALSGLSSTSAVGNTAATISAALSGVAGTAATGTTTATDTVALTGVSSTAATGTLSAAGDVSQALTGVEATAATGTTAATITVALSGVSNTAATGTVTSSTTVALSGQASTAATGNTTATDTVALTGVSGTAETGTITPTTGAVEALTGAAATAATGTVGVSVTVALTGSALAVAQGNIVVSYEQALSGVSSTAATGTVTPAISVALSGAAATAAAGTVGAPSSATVALTGQAMVVSQGTLIATGGTYIWTPVNDANANSWIPVVGTQSATWVPVST
jgi:hypothetical protein